MQEDHHQILHIESDSDDSDDSDSVTTAPMTENDSHQEHITPNNNLNAPQITPHSQEENRNLNENQCSHPVSVQSTMPSSEVIT